MPSVRLWEIGTEKMFGVSEGRFSLPDYRNLPKEIQEQLSWQVDVFGKFLVCPFTVSEPGVMQLVCIENGENLVAKTKSE
jgi:hypothetical protein